MDTIAVHENTYQPDYTIHPGEYLEEVLDAREIKKREFAERVGLSVKAVSQIINGKSLFSPEVALRFERVLGISASIWGGMAESYQLFEAREEQKRKLHAQTVCEWIRRFPIRDLKRLKILPDTRKQAELAEALLRFLGVSSIEAWETYSTGRAAAYRQSKTFVASREAVEVWLTIAERQAEPIETRPFDKKRFSQAVAEIRTFTRMPPGEFFPRMVALLAEAGVALVVVPELKGSRISGATRWLTSTRVMIALSLRHKSNDQFWFTFYHEAAHILLHGKKTFIDQKDNNDGKVEAEADEFSANLLVPEAEYRSLVSNGTFYEGNIRRFADEVEIHPGIVVGRLQHDGHLDFKFHNALKDKFELTLTPEEE
jgi:HTH-type transcriptional regulator / antitoxin HigA